MPTLRGRLLHGAQSDREAVGPGVREQCLQRDAAFTGLRQVTGDRNTNGVDDAECLLAVGDIADRATGVTGEHQSVGVVLGAVVVAEDASALLRSYRRQIEADAVT